MKLIHISRGGPIHTIQVNGKRHTFEMHPYCGPIAIGKRGNGLLHQAKDFLEAASHWAQQGRRVGSDGLCIWEHPAYEELITRPIGKRSAVVTGFKMIPARKGE